MKKSIRAISLVVGIIVSLNSTLCVQARDTELSDNVLHTTLLLEELLNQEYNDTRNSLESNIQESGWNYTLTMESFYDNGNPYSDLDYQKTIAAVCTLMNHSKKTIADIDFLNYDVSESSVEMPQPLKSDKYVETENGLYEKQGTYYIVTDGEYPVYVQRSDGYFEENGTQSIILDTEPVTYGQVTLSVKDPETLFADAGIAYADIEEEYESRLDKIIISGIDETNLEQSIFVQTQWETDLLSDDQAEQLQNAFECVTGNRLCVIKVASFLIGRVPYQWGGKSTKSGYDTSWYTFENGAQKGLDCSGFVQWVFRTAGYSEATWQQLLSTDMIMHTCEAIPQSDLQIGDLGILNTGETINHVGIYIGNGYYIHCNASDQTVSISKPNFSLFYRVPTIDDEVLMPETSVDVASSMDYSDEDLYLIAQTVWHEARGEGTNGWIAVAEVIKNRILSETYPNTAREVIYQDGQFSYNEEIADMVPAEAEIKVVKMVLVGNLSILGDDSVMWFRNPMIGSSTDMSEKTDESAAEVVESSEYVNDPRTESWNGREPYKIIGHHVFYK